MSWNMWGFRSSWWIPKACRGSWHRSSTLATRLTEAVTLRELLKRLEEQRAAVAARVKGLPRLKVLVVIWYDPVITAGSKSFITDVISAAGAAVDYRRYGPGMAPNQPGGSAAPVARLSSCWSGAPMGGLRGKNSRPMPDGTNSRRSGITT